MIARQRVIRSELLAADGSVRKYNATTGSVRKHSADGSVRKYNASIPTWQYNN